MEEARTRKEKMMQATLSDSNYSDAKSLLEWDDERALNLEQLRRRRRRKKKKKLIYSYAN
jgi:hypothetical protein